jgi:hypothetical protein
VIKTSSNHSVLDGPDQFKELAEAVKVSAPEGAGLVQRWIPASMVIRRLASYRAMLATDHPAGLWQAIELKQVLVDFCGILGLEEGEKIFILGEQLPLPGMGEK